MPNFPHRPDLARLKAQLPRSSGLAKAALDYALGAAPDRVRESVVAGVAAFAARLEAGFVPDPWEMWDHFLAAVAVDPPAADLLSGVPLEERADATLDGLAAQHRAAVTLFRGADPARALADADALPPAEEPAVALLRAIHEKNGPAFHRALEERMSARAESFQANGRNAPAGLLDLAALGLCRLARDREIEVGVKHVYLPLDVLA